MIIKKEKKNGVNILYVKKNKTDTEFDKFKNKYVKASMIKDIIKEDTDAYDADTNKLLLKFRKHKLQKKEIDEFYDNVISFAKSSYSTNRGSASGSDSKNVMDNIQILLVIWIAFHPNKNI